MNRTQEVGSSNLLRSTDDSGRNWSRAGCQTTISRAAPCSSRPVHCSRRHLKARSRRISRSPVANVGRIDGLATIEHKVLLEKGLRLCVAALVAFTGRPGSQAGAIHHEMPILVVESRAKLLQGLEVVNGQGRGRGALFLTACPATPVAVEQMIGGPRFALCKLDFLCRTGYSRGRVSLLLPTLLP